MSLTAAIWPTWREISRQAEPVSSVPSMSKTCSVVIFLSIVGDCPGRVRAKARAASTLMPARASARGSGDLGLGVGEGLVHRRREGLVVVLRHFLLAALDQLCEVPF